MSRTRYTAVEMARTRLWTALLMLMWSGCASAQTLASSTRSEVNTLGQGENGSGGPVGSQAVLGQSVHVERSELELKAQPPPGPAPKASGATRGKSDRTAVQARRHPFQRITIDQTLSPKALATLHANLSPAQCRTRLAASKAPFTRQRATSGIANPVRIGGEIGGVRFVAPGGKSPYGLLDCRLALTLVELAGFLRERAIVEVRVDNFYRPNARLPSRRAKKSQHAYGLAIDIMALKHRDGREFDVETDWGAGTESEPCGAKATLSKPTDNTVDLRNLVCDLVNAHLFHHHLTPSYDLAHRNHLHLDIKRDAKSLWVR